MSTPRWCFAWQKVLYFSFVSVERKQEKKDMKMMPLKFHSLANAKAKQIEKFIEEYVINPSAGGRIFDVLFARFPW
jgi:hypothetical protein